MMSPMRPDEYDATVPALEDGELLSNRYRLVRVLDRGGMGIVWIAEDTHRDGVQVAIKLLPAVLSRNARAVSRFRREAETCLGLTHPHIIRLYNIEQDAARGDLVYLVMQFVEGRTLENLLAEQEQGMALDRVQRWAEQLGSAIDYAHENDILHRDIKPSNIIIDGDDNALLIDFGIAREVRDETTRVTGQDSSGTLLYMSPQQVMGENSKSNDIYSLAATLYEALSGEPPFHSGGVYEQIQHKPASALPNQPDHVNTALLAGLAKQPEDRPDSATDLAGTLQGDTSDIGTQVKSDNSRFSETREFLDDLFEWRPAAGTAKRIRQYALGCAAVAVFALTVWYFIGVAARRAEDSARLAMARANPIFAGILEVDDGQELAPLLDRARELESNAKQYMRAASHRRARSTFEELLRVCETIRQLDEQRARARSLNRIVSKRREDASGVQTHPLGRDDWEMGDRSLHLGERAFADGDFGAASTAWTSAQGRFDKLRELKQKVDGASLAQRRLDDELAETHAELVQKYAAEEWNEVLEAVSRARAEKIQPDKIKRLFEAASRQLETATARSATAAQAVLEDDVKNVDPKLLASYSETVWPRAAELRVLCQETSDARRKLLHCDQARALTDEATVEALDSARRMFADEYTPATSELVTMYAAEFLTNLSAESEQVQSCHGTPMECVAVCDCARTFLGTVMSEVANRAENDTKSSLESMPVDILKKYAATGWAKVASLLESARQPDATSFDRARLYGEARGLLESSVPIEADQGAGRRFEELLAGVDEGLARKYSNEGWARVIDAQSRARAVDVVPIERAVHYDDGSSLIVAALIDANVRAEEVFRDRLSSMDQELMHSYASELWLEMDAAQGQAEDTAKDSMARLGHLDRGCGILNAIPEAAAERARELWDMRRKELPDDLLTSYAEEERGDALAQADAALAEEFDPTVRTRLYDGALQTLQNALQHAAKSAESVCRDSAEPIRPELMAEYASRLWSRFCDGRRAAARSESLVERLIHFDQAVAVLNEALGEATSAASSTLARELALRDMEFIEKFAPAELRVVDDLMKRADDTSMKLHQRIELYDQAVSLLPDVDRAALIGKAAHSAGSDPRQAIELLVELRTAGRLNDRARSLFNEVAPRAVSWWLEQARGSADAWWAWKALSTAAHGARDTELAVRALDDATAAVTAGGGTVDAAHAFMAVAETALANGEDGHARAALKRAAEYAGRNHFILAIVAGRMRVAGDYSSSQRYLETATHPCFGSWNKARCSGGRSMPGAIINQGVFLAASERYRDALEWGRRFRRCCGPVFAFAAIRAADGNEKEYYEQFVAELERSYDHRIETVTVAFYDHALAYGAAKMGDDDLATRRALAWEQKYIKSSRGRLTQEDRRELERMSETMWEAVAIGTARTGAWRDAVEIVRLDLRSPESRCSAYEAIAHALTCDPSQNPLSVLAWIESLNTSQERAVSYAGAARAFAAP